MNTLIIKYQFLVDTLDILKCSGKLNHEGIAFWLGRHDGNLTYIEEVYEPIHTARADYFHIPPKSMQDLQGTLRSKRLMIAAQIHSHPQEAFHSKADDDWAIIRHLNAVSIVLPYFAKQTTPESFFADAVVFQLSPANQWVQVPTNNIGRVCQVSL